MGINPIDNFNEILETNSKEVLVLGNDDTSNGISDSVNPAIDYYKSVRSIQELRVAETIDPNVYVGTGKTSNLVVEATKPNVEKTGRDTNQDDLKVNAVGKHRFPENLENEVQDYGTISDTYKDSATIIYQIKVYVQTIKTVTILDVPIVHVKLIKEIKGIDIIFNITIEIST